MSLSAIELMHVDQVTETVLEAVRTVQHQAMLHALPHHLASRANVEAIAFVASAAARSEVIKRIKEVH